MIHCYYCKSLILFTLDFKPQSRTTHVPLYPKAFHKLHCTNCKAEFIIDIKITEPPRMTVDDLRRISNAPVK